MRMLLEHRLIVSTGGCRGTNKEASQVGERLTIQPVQAHPQTNKYRKDLPTHVILAESSRSYNHRAKPVQQLSETSTPRSQRRPETQVASSCPVCLCDPRGIGQLASPLALMTFVLRELG